MLKNHLKIALRHLRKNKTYAFINIAGLALGIACCILITLYVRDELSYDDFHENGERIYRVLAESGRAGEVALESANTSFPIGPALQEAFPEVLEAVRFRAGYQAVVSYGENHFKEERFYFVDPSVFKVFSFRLEEGDPATALVKPNTLVLTRSMARKYFGEENPIGKVLTYNGWAGPLEFTIAGVLQDLPHNTHFNFAFLASLRSVDTSDFSWTWFTSLWTYVLLPLDYSPAQLKSKFPAFVRQYLPAKHKIEGNETLIMDLERLRDIHLYSRLDRQMRPNSDIVYVYLFVIVALFILAIACINFMNLSTARSLKRAKEVGMRKTLGAQRRQVIRQFLVESLFFAAFAVLLAITLLESLLPVFNAASGKALAIDYFNDTFILFSLLASVVLVGFGAGSYPAFYLSRFQPSSVLKGQFPSNRAQGAPLRRALVIFQFAIATLLIVGTVAVFDQLDYIRNKKLGANVEQVVVVPYSARSEALIPALQDHPNVIQVSASSRVPVNRENFDTRPMLIEGLTQPLDTENFNIDENFLPTFEIALAAGRNLSRTFAGDSTAMIINEAAVRHFGWRSNEEALGKRVGWSNGFKWGQVVGVVEDFHMVSLHESILPLVMIKLPEHYWYNFISVRIRPANIAETLRFVEATWRHFTPAGGYEYFFVDESFAQLHRADQRLGQVFGYFAAISIFIACLGLFGLVSYSAEQRTKEIGVRKVLGATVTQIFLLMAQDFTRLVLIGFLLAAPVSYFAMNKWLQNFAYRTDLGPAVFVVTAVSMLAIAVITVSFQSIKAALSNPVEALRYE